MPMLGKTKTKLIAITLVTLQMFAISNVGFGQAASATWALTSNAPVSTSGSVTATNATGGTGIGTINYGSNGMYANSWTNSSSKDFTDYFEYTISPSSGYDLTVTSISLYTSTSTATWTMYADVYYSLDGASFTQAGSTINVTNTLTQTTISSDLSILVADGGTLTLRVYGYHSYESISLFRNKSVVISGTTSSSGPSIALSDNGTQVTAASVVAGTSAVVLHKSALAVTGGSATLTGMTCTTAGNYVSADITNIKVRYSTDATLDAGDATLSTYTTPGTAGAKTFPSFTSQAISSGSTGYIFITADVASGATIGKNINISALTTSNFTFSSASKSGSTTAGGTQTITCSSPTTLLDPTGVGGFENATSTFAANGWTVVGSTGPTWYVGTAAGCTGATGGKAAFFGPTSTGYTGSTTLRVVHFYRDIAIPTGATNVSLSFYLKYPVADNGNDYFRVYTTTTSNTPTYGTSGGTGFTMKYENTSNTYANYTAITPIDLTSLAGTTVRLVFTFVNNGVAPNAYPAVDYISLTYCPSCTNPTCTAPATTPVTYCHGATASALTVSATAGSGSISTYQWYKNSTASNSGGTTVGTNSNSYTPPTTTDGTLYYYVVVTNSEGCTITSDVSGAVTITATPTTATNGSAQTICDGASGTLSGNNPTAGTGTWTVQSGPSTSSSQFASTSTYNTTFTPSGGAGSYVVRWTISNSPCTDSYADATITVISAPSSPGSITSNSPKCEGTGVTFTQGTCPASCTCYWENSATETSTALNSASTYTSSTAAGTYTMYVRAYNGTCWSTAVSSTGTVNSNPTISGTTSVVVGGTTTLTGSITPGTWSSSNTGVATISSGGVVTGVSAGSSTITFTVDATGCSGTTGVTVSSCSTPTNLTSSSVTQTSAVITWTAASPAPSSGYNIYYSTSSSAPTGGTTPSASVGAGITTYTIGGLTPGQIYYVWVRSNCGSSAYSSWTSSINFTCTSCGGGSYYYYRSISSGNWSISSTGTWERSSDGSSWSGTSTTPTSSNCCCARIQSGHTITLNADITAPNTIVDANGTLAISNNAITYGNGYVVTNNGTITVSVGGSQVSAWDNKGLVINGTGTLINNGTITINTGGTLTLSSTASGAKIINYGTIDNYGGSFSKISECIYLYIAIYGGINIQDKTLSSTVTNYGTITNHPPSISSGHYYYASSGNYYFRGYAAFYNLDNYGTIANGSVVTTKCNFGIIDLIGHSGIFNNYSGGTVNNYSVLFIGVDGVTCYSSTYNNYGTHNDYSETAIDYGSTFNNKSGANFNIKSTGSLALQEVAACGISRGTNDGTITNSSTNNDDYEVGMYIDGSSSFTNNNIIYDEGKIYNDGTFTNTTASQFIYRQTSGSITGTNTLEYKGNALLKYNGTDAQTTSKYEFPLSTSYSPSYVEIDNSSGASKGVTLHDNRTINYNTGNPPSNGVPYLTLTNGAFKLNSYTLTIESSSSSAIARNGTTQTGYIVSETLNNGSSTSSATPTNTCTSRIQWNDLGTSASEYTLPFGTTGGTYIPLKVNVTSTATGANGYFTAAIYHTSTSNYPYPSYPETVTNMNNKYGDNSSNAVDRFYLTSFSGYSSNPTVTYTFSYDGSNDLNGITESSLYAQYWDNSSSQWKRSGTGTADPANNQVNSVSGNNVSRDWVLSNSNNPLPVELLSFNAVCRNSKVFLSWTTASEINNDYFKIERSKDIDLWEYITTVNGSGNSNTPKNYYAIDDMPYSETIKGLESSYYRLIQVDYDGKSKNYGPVKVGCVNDDEENTFTAYVGENKNIIVKFEAHGEQDYSVYLFDNQGQKLINIDDISYEGTNQLTLNTSTFSEGIYVIYYKKGEKIITQKIVLN